MRSQHGDQDIEARPSVEEEEQPRSPSEDTRTEAEEEAGGPNGTDEPSDDNGETDNESSDETDEHSDEQTLTVRHEIHVVAGPNAKLLRQRQAEAIREALRWIRANPINGDPITRSTRW